MGGDGREEAWRVEGRKRRGEGECREGDGEWSGNEEFKLKVERVEGAGRVKWSIITANLGRSCFINPQKDGIMWLPPPRRLVRSSLTPRGCVAWPMHATVQGSGVGVQLVEREAHFREFSCESLDL